MKIEIENQCGRIKFGDMDELSTCYYNGVLCLKTPDCRDIDDDVYFDEGDENNPYNAIVLSAPHFIRIPPEYNVEFVASKLIQDTEYNELVKER